ncbi:hypothetical protein CDEST_10293 [Colletotrichum destructivum]|uniref:Uncharacterized protein n=1 Tax=Colletotrichum destructivum TaxID=34406 RepID=A0AAX4IPM6_9PEZI|nr:hypothetical protein CDEST_10293 [Colletotrichum destructivum]
MNGPTLLPQHISHQLWLSLFIQLSLELILTLSRHNPNISLSSNTDEEPEHLPYPAIKLIIAQYWHCSRDPPFWGYLIVGTFYDQHNNIVWSTEIFAFQPDPRRRQDTQSVASSEADVAPTVQEIKYTLQDIHITIILTASISGARRSQDPSPVTG